ncbi:MAG TPA: hypothetical protein VMN57_08945 [Anaerolineales bacterium]|nr:hypothetical protein [Anaerolineales bacterium]
MMEIDPRRVSAAWTPLILLATVCLLVGFLIGAPIYRRGKLEASLVQAARMYQIGYASHIALSEFTDFEWTEVHIFAPYTAIETVERETGTAWPRLASESIEKSDAITLLVFLDGNRLTRWVEMDRNIADYSDVAAESPYTPETAVFIMPVEGEAGIVVLQK